MKVSEIKVAVFCSFCHGQHIDEGKYTIKPHKVHLCFHCRKKFKVKNSVIFLSGILNQKKNTLYKLFLYYNHLSGVPMNFHLVRYLPCPVCIPDHVTNSGCKCNCHD